MLICGFTRQNSKARFIFICFIIEQGFVCNGYDSAEMHRAGFDINCGFGFAGPNCNEVITCEELSYCHGHGVCVRGGMCVCNPGWKGESCNQSFCQSNCSGHGSCLSSGEGCLCDTGYTGKICNNVECLGGGNCTGHGICLDGGVCICQKGYFGSGCETIDVAAKCSNHGIKECLFSVELFS
jgi:hypothetical protein